MPSVRIDVSLDEQTCALERVDLEPAFRKFLLFSHLHLRGLRIDGSRMISSANVVCNTCALNQISEFAIEFRQAPVDDCVEQEARCRGSLSDS